MNIHKNARFTPMGRGLLIARLERGERPHDVAAAMGVSVRTVYKWRKRHREEGLAGLRGRSSRPFKSPAKTSATIEARVVELRRQRRIFDRIAEVTGIFRTNGLFEVKLQHDLHIRARSVILACGAT